jgi:hypothetical protein
MSNQALEQEEILNIRWAHDDPNPVAQQSAKRANEDAIVAIMEAKGVSTKEVGFQYPDNYNVPDAKRQKLENGAGAGAQVRGALRWLYHNSNSPLLLYFYPFPLLLLALHL